MVKSMCPAAGGVCGDDGDSGDDGGGGGVDGGDGGGGGGSFGIVGLSGGVGGSCAFLGVAQLAAKNNNATAAACIFLKFLMVKNFLVLLLALPRRKWLR
jgi:hypothetical protein